MGVDSASCLPKVRCIRAISSRLFSGRKTLYAAVHKREVGFIHVLCCAAALDTKSLQVLVG